MKMDKRKYNSGSVKRRRMTPEKLADPRSGCRNAEGRGHASEPDHSQARQLESTVSKLFSSKTKCATADKISERRDRTMHGQIIAKVDDNVRHKNKLPLRQDDITKHAVDGLRKVT